MTFVATRSTAGILIKNLCHRHDLPLTRRAVHLGEGRPDTRERRTSSLEHRNNAPNVNVESHYPVNVAIPFIFRLVVIKDYESAFDAV